MAVAQGYGKTITSGSVFAYDTGDTRNSYIGEPTVNLAGTDTARTIAMHEPGAYGNAGIIADAPEKGPGWKKITITNRGNNFRIAQFPYISLTGGVTYTYSLEVDMGTTSGYYWRIDGSAGYSAITIVNNKVVTTITPSAGSYAIFLNHNTTGISGINEVIYYRYYQAENKTKATQFTTGTRSATQGLLPLVGNSTIDLTNVSFDSNAQMTFDGTNDYITLSPGSIPTGQLSFEFVCTNGNSGAATSILAGGAGDGNQDLNIHLPWSDGNVYWDCGRPFNRIYKATTLAERNGTHHWVFTKNPSTGVMNIYLDGALWETGPERTSTLPTLTAASLGRFDRGDLTGFYYTGTIPVFKQYNRALSAAEVRQNYLHYKTRFNLS